MTEVLAAIDDSLSAAPVLAGAQAIANLVHAEVVAIHVEEDGLDTVRAAAAAAGVPLRIVPAPVAPSLASAASPPAVIAMVVGARAFPAGRRPAGRTATSVVTSIDKPVLVVPPGARPIERIKRILVPLDGTEESSAALRRTIAVARDADVEVVVLHVHKPSDIPPFSEQPHHERAAWVADFLAREIGCEPDGVRLEVRVGHPDEHLVEACRSVDADLIALGWRRHLAPGHAAVVREALARSVVPVLLLPIPRSSP